ncbi:MAG: hypothetical protein HYX48_03700 [Chlamydiales bacterium]|nr:hypothetical protein [Chlamydiales bacterium]
MTGQVALRTVMHPMQDVEGVLPHILSFCPREKTLSLVSRAFCEASRHTMVEVGLQMLMRASDYEAQMVRASRRFVNAGESVQEAELRQREEFLNHLDQDTSRIDEYYSFEERAILRLLIFPFIPGATRDDATCTRRVIFLAQINAAFRNLYQTPGGEIEDEEALELREEQKDKIRGIAMDFAAEMSLRKRAEQVFQGRLDLSVDAPYQQRATCLRELHLSQRDGLFRDADRLEEFAASARSEGNTFALQRFLRAERSCVGLELEEHYDLKLFWNQLREEHPTVFPDGIDTVEAQRAWLNDPANAAQLATITHLSFSGLDTLPPEIGRFSALTRLILWPEDAGDDAVFPTVRNLPAALAELANLNSLSIYNAYFRILPEVLGRVRATVKIHGNHRQAILPESVARMHGSGIMSHLDEFFWAIFERPSDVVRTGEDRGSPVFMGLIREELSEIPFFLWFRDTFSIPYFYQPGILFFDALEAIHSFIENLGLDPEVANDLGGLACGPSHARC